MGEPPSSSGGHQAPTQLWGTGLYCLYTAHLYPPLIILEDSHTSAVTSSILIGPFGLFGTTITTTSIVASALPWSFSALQKRHQYQTYEPNVN
jgi:hypothetical protein